MMQISLASVSGLFLPISISIPPPSKFSLFFFRHVQSFHYSFALWCFPPSLSASAPLLLLLLFPPLPPSFLPPLHLSTPLSLLSHQEFSTSSWSFSPTKSLLPSLPPSLPAQACRLLAQTSNGCWQGDRLIARQPICLAASSYSRLLKGLWGNLKISDVGEESVPQFEYGTAFPVAT